MASQAEDDAVKLIRKMISEGKTLPISLEHPDSPAVKSAEKHGHNFSFAAGDGNCVAWVQVPGRGLVCVKRK